MHHSPHPPLYSRVHFLTLLLGLIAAPSLIAQPSAYLPAPGTWIISPAYSFQTADQLWLGNVHLALADLGIPGNLDQHTATLSTEYGIHRSLAVDATVGYTRVNIAGLHQDGMADSTFGLRYQILTEHRTRPSRPTLTLRVGAILEGTYDLHPGLPPTHPGDGASGGEIALLIGKRLGDSGVTAFGSAGYRLRTERVPEDFFASVGAQWSPPSLSWLGIHTVFRHEQALGGVDLFGASFTGDWREAKEINDLVETGLTFTPRQGPSITFFTTQSVGGRNTPDKSIYGIYLTWGFQTRRGPYSSPRTTPHH